MSSEQTTPRECHYCGEDVCPPTGPAAEQGFCAYCLDQLTAAENAIIAAHESGRLRRLLDAAEQEVGAYVH